jgi:hypothetical protein
MQIELFDNESCEIWKDCKVKGYQVSNIGRVRNSSYEVLKGSANSQGYRTLYTYKSKKAKLIHRLVFEAFIGDIPSDLEIDHINRNKLDNRPVNLRLATRSMNMRNRIDNSIHGACITKNKYGRYMCQVKRNKINKYIGTYDTAEEAQEARQKYIDEQGLK